MMVLSVRKRNRRVARTATKWAPLVSSKVERQSPSFARNRDGTPRRDAQQAPKKRPSIMNKLHTSNQHQLFATTTLYRKTIKYNHFFVDFSIFIPVYLLIIPCISFNLSYSYAQASIKKRDCTWCPTRGLYSEHSDFHPKTRTLPRSHKFHIECADKWLSDHDNYPMCRQSAKLA